MIPRAEPPRGREDVGAPGGSDVGGARDRPRSWFRRRGSGEDIGSNRGGPSRSNAIRFATVHDDILLPVALTTQEVSFHEDRSLLPER